ncbi:TetR/AcrR family transcriptional regulator [Actinophytocola oryzae]|uniref:TetR family transcriptional regulator n=1 Tax=Actinophytocola oryzae TaxID=502181 RepID=A0A4R7VB85_9PSEU|nr:TetR/AcrR family transcriptional regulator [Actinophytocola oryzae]TDV46293.1 TetR family transcriptional regulator [Actinophytocola oryzae]
MGQPVQTAESAATRPLSRKRRQTQARLLDAALDAFAERGFHGTSVEEVCERAGFSRGAFYSNYSSKTELLIALYYRQSERVLAALDKYALPAARTADGDFATMVTETLTSVPHDRRWFLVNAEFALHAIRNPAAGASFAAARNKTRAIFAKHVTEVVEQMGLELTVSADDLARWLFALNEGGVTQAYVEPDKLAPHELTRQMAPVLLAAVTRPASTPS